MAAFGATVHVVTVGVRKYYHYHYYYYYHYTLHVGGPSSTLNLRTRQAVVMGIPYSRQCLLYEMLRCFDS